MLNNIKPQSKLAALLPILEQNHYHYSIREHPSIRFSFQMLKGKIEAFFLEEVRGKYIEAELGISLSFKNIIKTQQKYNKVEKIYCYTMYHRGVNIYIVQCNYTGIF